MAVAPPHVTTDTEEVKNVKTYYNRTLVEYAKPKLIHAEFGNKDGVPRGYDASNPGTVDAIEWMQLKRIPVMTTYGAAAQRPEALYSAATLAQHDANTGGYQLTQGQDPTSSDANPVDRNIGITLIRATPQEYGAYYIGSARQKRSGYHNFREIVTEILGQNMGEVGDLVVRNQLVGQFAINYAGTATTVDTVAPNMYLDFQTLVEVVAQLKTYDVEPNRNGHFVAIIGPGTWASMMMDETFQRTVIFGNKNTMFDGMIDRGRLPWVGVEFYETTFVMRQAGALTTVYSTFIFGKDAYGVLDLEGMGNADNIFHDVGSAGTNDPMNQRWTQAWHATMVAKTLDTTRGVEVRHAVAV